MEEGFISVGELKTLKAKTIQDEIILHEWDVHAG